MTQFKIYKLCKDKGEIIMNNVKKNNKGFSLVELIVVVLIMAIIAVSLAPQVMKWVDQSRQSVDVQTRDSVVSAFTIASVDSAVNGKTATVTISKSGASWSGDATVQSKVNAIYNASAAKCKSGATISVTLNADGTVTSSITGLTGEVAAENPS